MILLPASEHQLAEALVASEEDRGIAVRSFEHLRIRCSRSQLRNVFDGVPRVAKGVHDLAVDALIGEEAHSCTYGIDDIKAKDIDGVLDRRQHALSS